MHKRMKVKMEQICKGKIVVVLDYYLSQSKTGVRKQTKLKPPFQILVNFPFLEEANREKCFHILAAYSGGDLQNWTFCRHAEAINRNIRNESK